MTRDQEEEEEEEEEEEVGGKDPEKVLEEMQFFHSHTLSRWREALTQGECVVSELPAGGSREKQQDTTVSCSDLFSDSFRRLAEELENIIHKLSTIVTKRDPETPPVSAEDPSEATAAPQETPEPEFALPPPEEESSQLPDEEEEEEEEEHGGEEEQTSDFTGGDSVEEAGHQTGVKGQAGDSEDRESPAVLREEAAKETGKETKVKVKGEETREWITVGLTGETEDGRRNVPDACFVRARSVDAAAVLRCEMADHVSSRVVSGSEELLSRVVRLGLRGGGATAAAAGFPFPATVVVPFCARYRGNYRDVAVKVMDGGRRVSYVTPVTTEGVYGGQKGSFAEVKVYFLGLFAVVSCLKRENYTVPRGGLTLKLSTDPRVCLSYLPQSFTAPVTAQATIQPIDSAVLASVRSSSDAYYPVVSTSPLLHLAHPAPQTLRRPLSVTLPCPPHPDNKRGKRQEVHRYTSLYTATPATWNRPLSPDPPLRKLDALSTLSREASDEVVVLGSRDKQWSVLERAAVRNRHNGLVSFQVTENYDRLLALRVTAPLQPSLLASLAEELEEALGRHGVTIVLRRQQQQQQQQSGGGGDPRSVLVGALLSRELSWELSRLRAAGGSGGPGGILGTSPTISMCEGEQLLLSFSGNITSTKNQDGGRRERLTFHSQRPNDVQISLTEVDPLGNHSSAHYKGTLLLYRLRAGEGAGPQGPQGAGPVCSLPLTLPKRVRSINRPIVTKRKLCEETDSSPSPSGPSPSDSLLLWLSEKLSEEDVSALAPSLRLRRSAAPRPPRLRSAGATAPSSGRAFGLLRAWRRGRAAAPTPQAEASHLAQCLMKVGRSDLAREILNNF